MTTDIIFLGCIKSVMGLLDKIRSGLNTLANGVEDGASFVKDHVEKFGDQICPSLEDPYDEPNVCSDKLREIYKSKYSCSNLVTHNDAATKFCRQFSENFIDDPNNPGQKIESGEWETGGYFNSLGTPCQISLTHPYTKGKWPCLQSVGVGIGVAAIAVVGIGASVALDVATVGAATPILVVADAALIGAFTGTGAGVECTRRSWNGDPFRCCLQDMYCNKDKCWEDSSSKKKMRTCDPRFRDAGGSDCQTKIKGYCLGTGTDSAEFIARWTTRKTIEYDVPQKYDYNAGPNYGHEIPGTAVHEKLSYDVPICEAMLYRVMYRNSDAIACAYQPVSGIIPDTDGYAWAKDLIDQVFKRYVNEGGSLINPILNGPMIQQLESICRKSPGLCEGYLTNYCKNFTEDTVNNNPFLSKWCGCHMSNDFYERYSSGFGITKACTPICHLPGTVPSVGDDGVTPLVCAQQVCMIDNLTIDMINSRVGDVEITDICSGCIGCSCRIADNTIATLESTVGKLSIVNQCSANLSRGGSNFGDTTFGSVCVRSNFNADQQIAENLLNRTASTSATTTDVGSSVPFDCAAQEVPTLNAAMAGLSPDIDETVTNSSSATCRPSRKTVIAYSGLSLVVLFFILTLMVVLVI